MKSQPRAMLQHPLRSLPARFACRSAHRLRRPSPRTPKAGLAVPIFRTPRRVGRFPPAACASAGQELNPCDTSVASGGPPGYPLALSRAFPRKEVLHARKEMTTARKGMTSARSSGKTHDLSENDRRREMSSSTKEEPHADLSGNPHGRQWQVRRFCLPPSTFDGARRSRATPLRAVPPPLGTREGVEGGKAAPSFSRRNSPNSRDTRSQCIAHLVIPLHS